MKKISKLMFYAASAVLAYAFLDVMASYMTGRLFMGMPPLGYPLAMTLYLGSAAAAVISRQPTPSQ